MQKTRNDVKPELLKETMQQKFTQIALQLLLNDASIEYGMKRKSIPVQLDHPF